MIAATHDGIFHADDVLGGAIIRRVFPDAAITRTRNVDALANADLRFDVGGQSNGNTDFDHHQPGGAGARANGIQYAAAGLLWHAFGAWLCQSAAVAERVDATFICQVDAHDNGQALTREPAFSGVYPGSISSVLNLFRPTWQEEQDLITAYLHSVVEAGIILDRTIAHAKAHIDAQTIVQGAIAAAIDPRVVVFNQYVPWHEEVQAQSAAALLVVYPTAGSWRVQTIATHVGGPSRMLLPESWASAGKDAATFSRHSGVADATFAHRARFIAGAETREGAIKLAWLAIDSDQNRS